jgi:hypothetical protein
MPSMINFDQKPSKDYINFLLEEAKSREKTTFFEKFCSFAEILGLEPPANLKENMNKAIAFSSLNVTAKGVFSAAVITFLVLSLFSTALVFFLKNTSLLLILFVIPVTGFLYVYRYPYFLSQVQKIQTGDEAIKIILYMIIYLKLNPTFEGAVLYASAHTKGPLSNDIKKAIWDTQTGKYRSIEEALSFYIPKWVVWNEDFVRALSLIHGVLIEPSEQGRDEILKKSLEFMLENTREKMKSYVEDITASINILHILGILLPVMTLIMAPLVSMFLSDMVNPFIIGFAYIVILPTILYFLINRILLKRPSAFIVPDISNHPDVPPKGKFYIKIGKSKIAVSILLVSILVSLIIMSYGILHFANLYNQLNQASQDMKEEILKGEASITLENILSSLSISIGLGTGIFLYFYLSSFQKIKVRNDIKNIESDFQIGLYSLGNYLSEGYPIEKSVEKSIDEYEKLGMTKKPIYEMFTRILQNMRQYGMTFKRSIFDKTHGVIKYFPSVLIEEIMSILSSASERSSQLLGKVSKTIGNYIENLNIVESKIKELLEDVRSGIRVQATFVIPLVCAIVASLGIFILNMMVTISCELQKIEKSFGFSIFEGSDSFLTSMIGSFSRMMPMTVLQVIIGVYTIEVVIIMSFLLNGIENGFDEVSKDYITSHNLSRSMIIYIATFLISLLVFNYMIVSMQSSTFSVGCR